MGRDTAYDKEFDAMSRHELERWARNWSIPEYESMSDDELRKRLKSVQGTTGVAPESDAPIEVKGPPQPGHET